MWYSDWVTVGGTGLVGGEGEVRWKELHRQEWAGLDWDREAGARNTRATPRVVVVAMS